ncbi:MAG: PepSY-associated TM helix domain-containing protein [Pseudomonadota bacterium]
MRKIHYWSAPFVLLPLGLVIVTGVLLMLKKELDWVQPPTLKGTYPSAIPTQTLEQLFDRARQVPELDLGNWTDLSRVDVKPDKGVVKFVSRNRWEAQIDAHSGELVHLAYRRSDLIESLHDGSFFTDWSKHYVFLPSGVILLLLWGTGIYLFFIVQTARNRKAQRLSRRDTSA